LCLAGLTRNGRDFHDLALSLSNSPSNPRTVYTVDYRGRGLSDFDTDWRNYTISIEMLDVIDFMTLTGLHDAVLIGTSRGGLITMLLAAARPGAIGAAVLNDIGPVIEHDGLARISGYVGRMPLPISWADAARMMRDINRRHFPDIRDDVWEEAARQWYNERNGKPAPGYDAKLGNALSVLDGPIPPLWPQFEALKRVPLMVVRGENSDILTAATVDEMRRRHPAMATVTVSDQGHAPLLKDAATIEAIRHFLTATDIGRQYELAASYAI
jgi:pimeloyl-ACP methyl ester carboxylesterase